MVCVAAATGSTQVTPRGNDYVTVFFPNGDTKIDRPTPNVVDIKYSTLSTTRGMYTAEKHRRSQKSGGVAHVVRCAWAIIATWRNNVDEAKLRLQRRLHTKYTRVGWAAG